MNIYFGSIFINMKQNRIERERERRGVKNVFKIPPDFIIDRIFRGLTFYQRKEISKKEEKSSFDQGLSIALAVA